MISVLTVNYFTAEDLHGLIDSLRKSDIDETLELIVTNNSMEEPLELASDAKLPIKILPSDNIGFGCGINLALRESSGDKIFITNPDVRVQPETIRNATEYLAANPDIGIILPKLRYADGEIQPSVRQFYTWRVILHARSPLRAIREPPLFFRKYLCEGIDQTRPTDVDWGLGAAMFLRRNEIEDGQIFDERYFLYFEDVDLCYRTWKRGQRVVYCPQFECRHDHRRSSGQPVSKAGWYHFQSLMRFIGKHRGLPKR